MFRRSTIFIAGRTSTAASQNSADLDQNGFGIPTNAQRGAFNAANGQVMQADSTKCHCGGGQRTIGFGTRADNQMVNSLKIYTF